MQQRRKLRPARVLAGMVVAGLAACVPDAPRGFVDTAPTGPLPGPVPTTGSLVANLAISGSEPPAELAISLDGGEPVLVANGGNARWEDLEPGDHSLEVIGVPGNCDVAGDNPATTSVAAGLLAVAFIEVDCRATVGAIRVTATTTGDEVDDDGYEIRLDGETVGRIDVNGLLDLLDIEPGPHEVRLRDVAKDCDVSGSRTRTVEVVAGDVAAVHYDVECRD